MAIYAAPMQYARAFLTISRLADISHQGRSTAVTWAYGHLVDWSDEAGLANKWSLETLPVLPDRFRLHLKDGVCDLLQSSFLLVHSISLSLVHLCVSELSVYILMHPAACFILGFRR